MQIITRTLSAFDIDESSEDIMQFLESIGMDKENIIRIRYSMEELLLRWRDFFGEDTSCRSRCRAALRSICRQALLGFALYPVNQAMLQIRLVREASAEGTLDETLLRRTN